MSSTKPESTSPPNPSSTATDIVTKTTTTTSSRPEDSSTDKMAAMTASRLSPELSVKTNGFTSSDSPPHSPSSPLSAKRSRSPLSIDLTSIPPLSSPAPPSNTLLITRLEDPKIFHPASLATIREHITSIAPLNSFSPLKSMARLIVSFYNEADAIKVRQEIDRTAFTPTSIAKCYFGEPTPVGDQTKYLERPDAGRLFFISPPPSPPVGWEMRNEDPPNKQVHADDLASKLSRLTGKLESDPMDEDTIEESKAAQLTADELRAVKATPRASSPSGRKALASALDEANGGTPTKIRSRSSTLIYDPKAHGDSPALPAVMLETEDDSDVELDEGDKKPMAHTARPPVELME